MPESPKDSILRLPQRVKNTIGILVATATAAGCSPRPTQPPIGSTETSDPALTQPVPAIETPSPTEFVPTLTPSGPETTPSVSLTYPGSLTVEAATRGIAAVVDAPPEITGLAEVQAIVAKHAQLARDKGLVFDHLAVKYAPADQRWFPVPVAADGTTIAGWLMIADSSSGSGWRYGEQPTWDSRYSPSADVYQYGLPALHDSANHFVVGFENGFPVLIEVTPAGAPQYWNDVVEKTTEAVEGAVIPKSAWQTAIETQDPADRFFNVVDGAPVIDLYETPAAESIVLNRESIQIVTTTDGLNPDILTARDADGTKYAFNPDHGWFALPEVQLDYTKLTKYTEVDQAFIEDGRANITTALLYAENPTISPDAIDPVYWVSYRYMDKASGDRVPMLCNNACGFLGVALEDYPEEFKRMSYVETNKPFAWTGFYKVHLESGETVYVVSRTLKNPSETNPDQTANLFYGFDQHTYEKMNIFIGGYTDLDIFFKHINRGTTDLVIILPPPPSLDGSAVLFNLSPDDWITGGNPVVAGLQRRGELISLFDPANLQIMTQILHSVGIGSVHDYVAPLANPLPAGFSRHILLAGFMNR